MNRPLLVVLSLVVTQAISAAEPQKTAKPAAKAKPATATRPATAKPAAMPAPPPAAKPSPPPAPQWARPSLVCPDPARREEWLAEWSRALPSEATLTQGMTTQSFGMSSTSYRTYAVTTRIENKTAWNLAAAGAMYVVETPVAGSSKPLKVLNGYFRQEPAEDFSGAVETREEQDIADMFRSDLDFDSMGLLNTQAYSGKTRLRVYGNSMFEISMLGDEDRSRATFGSAPSGKSLAIDTGFQLGVVVSADKLDDVFLVSPALWPGDGREPATPFVQLFRFRKPAAAEKAGTDVKWDLVEKQLLPLDAGTLLPLMTDESAPLWRRVFAARWAGRHAKDASAPLLTGIVTATPRKNDALRTAALAGLGAAKPQDALATIAGVAANDKEKIEPRTAAVRALGEIQNPEATPMLVRLAQGKGDYADDAIKALGKSGDRSALDPLFAILENPKGDNQRFASQSIAKLADDATVERLQRDALTSRSASEHAISALGDIGTDRACAALAAVFTGGATPEAKKNVAGAVADIDKPQALEILRLGLADPATEVRQAAARGIAGVKGADRDKALVEAIGSSDPEVQKIVIQETASRKIAEGKPQIVAVINAPAANPKARVAAVDALRSYPGDETKALLVTLLRDPNAEVRKSAIEGLKDQDAKPAAGEVAGMLRDPDKDVRWAAALALKKFGDKSQGAALVEALLVEKEDLALSAMVDALKEIKYDDVSAFPKIVDRFRAMKGWARSSIAGLLNSMSGLKVELKWDAKAADVERAAAEWMAWWTAHQGAQPTS